MMPFFWIFGAIYFTGTLIHNYVKNYSIVIKAVLALPLLIALLLASVFAYILGMPVACFYCGQYLHKRFRYKTQQELQRRKLRLLNFLIADKSFAVEHAKNLQ